MTKILIPHGTTPTGFGIRQRSNGALRAISKCCGRSLTATAAELRATCKGCSKDYSEFCDEHGCSLANDIPINKDSLTVGTIAIIEGWVCNVTGYPTATVSLD